MSSGPQGFPDYQRFQQVVSAPILNKQSVTLSGVTTFGPFYVGHTGALKITNFSIPLANAFATMVAQFYADSATTIALDQSEINLAAGSTSFDIIPVVGDFVTFQFFLSTYGATNPITIVVSPLSIYTPGLALLDNSGVFIDTSVVGLAGGASSTILSTVTKAGPASLGFTSSQPNWSVEVDVATSAFAFRFLNGVDSPAGNLFGSQLFILPSATPRVVVTNRAGIAANVSVSLVSLG